MGDVVISLDAELAWGYHDFTQPERIPEARSSWTAALELFERYDVPATWAIVGHLFLDECDGVHEEHPLGGEWFDTDPGGSEVDDELWYGRDFIREILDDPVDHEVACHSFSHVEMNSSKADRETVEAEIAGSLEAAEYYDVSLESFVFPRNSVGHRDVLAEHGFLCYRGKKAKPRYDGLPLQPLVKLLDWSIGGGTPPIVTPYIDEYGLVDIPASLYLFSFEGLPRRLFTPVWDDPIVTMARRGIDRVCDDDGVFHMWLHPHNLLQRDGVERLESILAYVDERREETDLRVKTMREVARETLADRAHVPGVVNT